MWMLVEKASTAAVACAKYISPCACLLGEEGWAATAGFFFLGRELKSFCTLADKEGASRESERGEDREQAAASPCTSMPFQMLILLSFFFTFRTPQNAGRTVSLKVESHAVHERVASATVKSADSYVSGSASTTT